MCKQAVQTKTNALTGPEQEDTRGGQVSGTSGVVMLAQAQARQRDGAKGKRSGRSEHGMR